MNFSYSFLNKCAPIEMFSSYSQFHFCHWNFIMFYVAMTSHHRKLNLVGNKKSATYICPSHILYNDSSEIIYDVFSEIYNFDDLFHAATSVAK